MADINPENIFNQVISSSKYKFVYPPLIERIIFGSIKKFKKEKDVIKAVKSKLHQIYGAYTESFNISKFDSLIVKILDENNLEIRKTLIIELFLQHSSSKERVNLYPDFYSKIFDLIGFTPGSVLDLACGLNGFSVDFLPNDCKTKFTGVEIDSFLVEKSNLYFEKHHSGSKLIQGDIFEYVNQKGEISEFDAVFLLKTLPCIEQQEKGISQKLIDNLNCRVIVVSYPAKSLTGKEKGMVSNYTEFQKSLIFSGETVSFQMDNELFFIMKRE